MTPSPCRFLPHFALHSFSEGGRRRSGGGKIGWMEIKRR